MKIRILSESRKKAKQFLKQKGVSGAVAKGLIQVASKMLGDSEESLKMISWFIVRYLISDPLGINKAKIVQEVGSLEQVPAIISLFQENVSKGKVPKDINSYNSLLDILEANRKAEEKETRSEKSKRISEDFLVLYKNDWLTAGVALTHEASCKYGAGTKWCVAQRDEDGYFKNYNEVGEKVVFLFFEDLKGIPRKFGVATEYKDEGEITLNGVFDEQDEDIEKEGGIGVTFKKLIGVTKALELQKAFVVIGRKLYERERTFIQNRKNFYDDIAKIKGFYKTQRGSNLPMTISKHFITSDYISLAIQDLLSDATLKQADKFHLDNEARLDFEQKLFLSEEEGKVLLKTLFPSVLSLDDFYLKLDSEADIYPKDDFRTSLFVLEISLKNTFKRAVSLEEIKKAFEQILEIYNKLENTTPEEFVSVLTRTLPRYKPYFNV